MNECMRWSHVPPRSNTKKTTFQFFEQGLFFHMTIEEPFPIESFSIRVGHCIIVGHSAYFYVPVITSYVWCNNFLRTKICLNRQFLVQNSWPHKFPTSSFDPLGRPTVTANSDHYYHICRPYVCPSPLFKISQNKTIHLKIRIATSATVGLAEGILDDQLICS